MKELSFKSIRTSKIRVPISKFKVMGMNACFMVV